MRSLKTPNPTYTANEIKVGTNLSSSLQRSQSSNE